MADFDSWEDQVRHYIEEAGKFNAHTGSPLMHSVASILKALTAIAESNLAIRATLEDNAVASGHQCEGVEAYKRQEEAIGHLQANLLDERDKRLKAEEKLTRLTKAIESAFYVPESKLQESVLQVLREYV